MSKGIPRAAVVGSVVLGVTAVASIAAAGIVGRLVGGTGEVPVGMLLITIGTLVVFGLLALAGAIGTWRGTAWGWAAGLAVLVVGVLGAGSATLAGGFEPPLLAAVALFGLLAISLAAPSVRARAGIGADES